MALSRKRISKSVSQSVASLHDVLSPAGIARDGPEGSRDLMMAHAWPFRTVMDKVGKEPLTLEDRAELFNVSMGHWPASHVHLVNENGHGVLYGRWVLGNDYRAKNKYYGEYPPNYLARVMALFPDVWMSSDETDGSILHAFSGSLPKGKYDRCDVMQDVEFRCRVEGLSLQTTHRWALVVADPPYSADDALKYGTVMIDRRKVLAALAQVTLPGGYLCWLDTTWPMHSKKQWLTVGRIAITRSTNHRIRDLTIFQRQEL